jgi:ankyrin repeat protein
VEKNTGETSSHHVSLVRFGTLTQVLLERGADINSQDENHMTPLHIASLYGRLDIVRILVDHGAATNLVENLGRTPLHLVAEGKYNFEQDRIRIAQLLLEHGADVNAQDGENVTPLHVASYGGRVAIAQMLLNYGAAANSKSNHGMAPLHSVAEGKCLYSKDDGARVVGLLLECGADINALDEHNMTPLHLASYYGAVEISRALLDGGATINPTSKHGRTPLHAVAVSEDYYSRDNDSLVTKLLLDRGAGVNVPDDDNTPLHLASYSWKVGIVQVLLNGSANVSAKDAQGRTPLHLVTRCPNRDPYYSQNGVGVARLLLEHGADVNAQEKNHATPSDLALHHGRTEIASLLLHFGGKTNAMIVESPRLEGVQFHNEDCPPEPI